jgi:hypothetical protein
MRKPSPALLVTSVVIALTGSMALAQNRATAARPATTTTMTSPASTSTSTGSAATTSASSSSRVTGISPTVRTSDGRTITTNANGGTTTTVQNGDGTFTTTMRNSDGSVAGTITTAGAPATDANGSLLVNNGTTTAAPTVGNPTVVTNSDGSTTSTTLNANGTRTIVTTAVDGTTTSTTLPGNLFNPGLVNGAVGGVTLDGERLLDERDRALAIDRSAVSVDLVSLGTATADVQRSSVSLDRVIKSAERDRKKIGRNGQLLNTIAPRTNVDRSSEMPDDGPTPALSGLANSLSRR